MAKGNPTKSASRKGALNTEGAPTLGPRGPGRPRKLKREQMENICRLLAQGLPIKHATRACGIVRSMYYRWKTEGEADLAAGRRTLESEFSDMVDIYEAVGAAGLWGRVVEGTLIATTAKGAVDAKLSRARVDAGKLALAAYNTRFAGRDGAPPARDGDGAEDGASTQAPPRRADLSKLSPDELREYARLTRLVLGTG